MHVTFKISSLLLITHITALNCIDVPLEVQHVLVLNVLSHIELRPSVLQKRINTIADNRKTILAIEKLKLFLSVILADDKCGSMRKGRLTDSMVDNEHFHMVFALPHLLPDEGFDQLTWGLTMLVLRRVSHVIACQQL